MRDRAKPPSADDLLAVFESSVDPAYAAMLRAVGLGRELVEQAAEQLSVVGRTVRDLTQRLYLLPWSGQVSPPASGAARATVQLLISRRAAFDVALALPAGLLIEEEALVPGPDGPIASRTGRTYALDAGVFLAPGEAGPVQASATAATAGEGYNAPVPASIRLVVQVGARHGNVGAALLASADGFGRVLAAANSPDVPVPDHVGCYVRVAVPGSPARVFPAAAYLPPAPEAALPHGGALAFPSWRVYRLAASTRTFAAGEVLRQGSRSAVVVGHAGTYLAASATTTALQPGAAVADGPLGGSVTVDSIHYDAELPTSPGGVEWRVLSWVDDLGVVVTNEASPAGGALALLDELAYERGRHRRSPGEDDQAARSRVVVLEDVVSPNAIQRAINRAARRLGWVARYVEPGTRDLPGFFLDVPDGSDFAYASALDAPVVAGFGPALLLPASEGAAFFFVVVPRSDLGDYGFTLDHPVASALDSGSWALDGRPTVALDGYAGVWAAANAARSGGVGFAMVVAGEPPW